MSLSEPTPLEDNSLNSPEGSSTLVQNSAKMSKKQKKRAKKRILSESPSAQSDAQKRINLDDSLSLAKELGVNLYEPDTPHWVPLLLKVCDVMSKDIKGICSQMSKFEAFQSEITNRVTSLENISSINAGKTLEIEKNIAFVNNSFEELKSEISNLKQQNVNLKKSVDSLVLQVDSNEQHNRNECLLIHGIPEYDKETPTQSGEIFAKKVTQFLGVNMKSEVCIKRAHRLGKKRTDGKPRPIIVRLWSPELRNIIYAKKKLCKGNGFSITENLTKRRLILKKEAETKYGESNVWTKEGRLYAKEESGNIITLLS